MFANKKEHSYHFDSLIKRNKVKLWGNEEAGPFPSIWLLRHRWPPPQCLVLRFPSRNSCSTTARLLPYLFRSAGSSAWHDRHRAEIGVASECNVEPFSESICTSVDCRWASKRGSSCWWHSCLVYSCVYLISFFQSSALMVLCWGRGALRSHFCTFMIKLPPLSETIRTPWFINDTLSLSVTLP